MIVRCTVKNCIWNYNERCEAGEITISDEGLRADGFYPRCLDYEEDEEE